MGATGEQSSSTGFYRWIPGCGQSGSLKAVTKSPLKNTQFFFGASVYPELQTKDEWNKMLEHFQRGHMKR